MGAEALPPLFNYWRVEMLGGLRIYAPGSSVPISRFRTHKAALLLARLALFAQRAHGREELVELLWPDAPIERGRANLSQALLHLRRAIEITPSETAVPPLWIADHNTVRLQAAHVQTDTARFEQTVRQALAASPQDQPALLHAALKIYQGDLLPGVYEDWAQTERERFTALRDRAEDVLARLAPLRSATFTPDTEKVACPVSDRLPAPRILLPLVLTRFFGREAERARLQEELTQSVPCRLATLLGVGGIGKTRLALEAAQTSADSGTGWSLVAFIPLAEVQKGEQIAAVLADTLGIERGENQQQAAFTALNRHASRGRLLLVLDNLEQMGETAAPFVEALLTQVPAVTILATSRQPVGIAGEQELWIGPLGETPQLQEAQHAPDIRLFVDRAKLVSPDFTITDRNREAVCKICHVCEGVPLALELAAAWIRVLSPAQIAERLSKRFDLLTVRGRANAHKRHRSLHAAIAWSFDLLPLSLQVFWANLSVFRGGFTLEAAQAVTGIANGLEPLALLTERSLVVAEPEGGESGGRYRLLESLREWGEERHNPAEWMRLQTRHVAYFADFGEQIAKESEATSQTYRGHYRLREERDNIGAALSATLTPPYSLGSEATGLGVRLACYSVYLWPLPEQIHWWQKAITALDAGKPDKPDQDSWRLRLLLNIVHNLLYTGRLQEAETALNNAREVCERTGDKRNRWRVDSLQGQLALRRNELPNALRLWGVCLQQARDENDEARQAACFSNMGVAEALRDNLAQGRTYLEHAAHLNGVLFPNSHLLASSLSNLGAVLVRMEDYQSALRSLEEAHAIAVADGAEGLVGVSLTNLAHVHHKLNSPWEKADSLLAEAQQIFERTDELPRMCEVLEARFEFALARGDISAAEVYGKTCLRGSRELSQSAGDQGDFNKYKQKVLEQAQATRHGELAARLHAFAETLTTSVE